MIDKRNSRIDDATSEAVVPISAIATQDRRDRSRACGAAALAIAVAVLLPLSPAAGQTSAGGTAAGATAALPAPIPPSGGAPLPGDSDIRARLAGTPVIAGEHLNVALLERFYAAHQYQPAWDSRQQQAGALWNAVLIAGSHGLDPALFHAAVLNKAQTLSPIDRDILLSDAFLAYAEALARGAVPFEDRMDDEDLKPEPVDVAAALESAIADPDPAARIAALAPNSPAYNGLRYAYQRYQGAAQRGGWPQLPDGRQPALLQRRLAAEGYLPAGYSTGAYDATTAAAVRGFQERHGLQQNGRLDRATIAELNVSAEQRVREIAINLERLRWLPRVIPADRVWVNSGVARLKLYRGGQEVFTTRVVVGQTDNQTPEFATTIESVLFNPPWNIPPSIAAREILPRLSQEPDYLARHHMVWRRGGSIQQAAGPYSALGRLKFEMNDRFDVYLHDTPLKNLLTRRDRRLSHGCVRVENPRELAALLLGEPVETINNEIAAGYTHRKALPVAVPVFIVYHTAFTLADGSVEFRRDEYDRNDEVWRGLARGQQPPLAERVPAGQRRG